MKNEEFIKHDNELNELKNKLEFKNKNISEVIDDEELLRANKFCDQYIDFLNNCKTERETVSHIKDKAIKSGYKKFNESEKYKPGDKIYFDIKNKSIILSTIGKNSLDNGTFIVASHVDSPRIDLKTRPLYLDGELAMFKTHYYGGIKKYQWVTMPLALHGVIVKKGGQSVNVCIGEQDGDIVFCITDLLPHLDKIQDRGRFATDPIIGEQLNVLVGSLPLKQHNLSGDVKLNILKLLNEKYDIVERDLISADLSFVPAFKANNIGLDKSLIGAYGQDDRVCVYASLMSELEVKVPELTTINMFVDREEVGSRGNTGLNSDLLKNYLFTICGANNRLYNECIKNTICLSADVKPAYDPTWSRAYEKNNCAYLNCGISISKYTGYGGKLETSEASAELIRKVIDILDNNNVIWQTSLNKVDQGGGGTVAKFIAQLGIDVIDIGVPILSMHSPYEVVSKLDVYMLYRGIKSCLN